MAISQEKPRGIGGAINHVTSCSARESISAHLPEFANNPSVNRTLSAASINHRDLILYEKPNQSQTANGRESTRIQSLPKKEAIPPFLPRSGSVRAVLLDVLQLFSSIALAWDKRNRPTTIILTLADDTLNVFDNSASVGAWRGQRFPPIQSYFAMRNV